MIWHDVAWSGGGWRRLQSIRIQEQVQNICEVSQDPSSIHSTALTAMAHASTGWHIGAHQGTHAPPAALLIVTRFAVTMQTPFCVRCLVFTPSCIFSSIITSNISSNFLHALFDNHSEVSEALTWYYMVLHAKYSKSSSTYLIYLYMLYIALHSCMMLYDAVCEYMWMMWDDASLWVYTCLHWQHLTAMRGIHGYIWLYTAIYGYIRLYSAEQHWTARLHAEAVTKLSCWSAGNLQTAKAAAWQHVFFLSVEINGNKQKHVEHCRTNHEDLHRSTNFYKIS